MHRHRGRCLFGGKRASRERRGSGSANCGNGRRSNGSSSNGSSSNGSSSNGSSLRGLSRGDERSLPEVFEVSLTGQAIGHDDIANGVSSQDIVGGISIGRAFKVGQASI